MPAVNPRLTITLKPEVHSILRRMSALTENSQSAIVGDLLESSLPVFERVVKVMEAANAAKESLSSDVAGGLARAQSKIEAQLGLALGEMDEAYRPILEQAKGSKRTAKSGSAADQARPAGGAVSGGETHAQGVSTPVPVTRGSGPHKVTKTALAKGSKRARV